MIERPAADSTGAPMPSSHAPLLFVLAAGLSGCDHLETLESIFARKVDAKEIEDDIASSLRKERLAIASITCPRSEKARKGVSFECAGVAADGTEFAVAVEMKSRSGYSWKLVGQRVDPTRLAAVLLEETGAQFDCGAQPRVAVAGVEIVCRSGDDVVTYAYLDDAGDMRMSGLSSKKVARDLETSLERDGVPIRSLVCPQGKRGTAGESFACNGEAEDGAKFTVAVRMTEGNDIEFEIVETLFDPAVMSEQGFDCGKTKRIAVKGLEIPCKDGEDAFTIAFVDDEGGLEIIEGKRRATPRVPPS